MFSYDVKEIKKIPKLEALKDIAQIYVGYKRNNRWKHTQRVVKLGLRILEEKDPHRKIPREAFVIAANLHDLGTFPTAHTAEKVVSTFLGQEWDHAMQAVYMLEYIFGVKLSLEILDAIAHHRKLCQHNALVRAPESVEEILCVKQTEAAFMIGLVLKAADELDNCWEDPRDARNIGVDVSEILPVRHELGPTRSDFEKNAIKGITIGNDFLSFSDRVWPKICDLKNFAYSKIHSHDPLPKQRQKQSEINRDILEGIAHIILTNRYSKAKGILVFREVRDYLDSYERKYDRLASLPFVKAPIEKFKSKDIFSMQSDSKVDVLWESIGTVSVADPKLNELLSC